MARHLKRLGPAILIAVLCPSLPVPTAMAQELVGTATVIDGDTIDIHGQRIRFHGIDAPESNQMCEAGGVSYRCGQKSALALSDRAGRATVSCKGKDVDRYGRIVAVCFKGQEDLNAWMVSQGWAVSYRRYSEDYVVQEDAARTAAIGMWAGKFVMPWDWRRGVRLASEKTSASPSGCEIKGNISSKGKMIYHVPGDLWYDKTKIDPARGERFFCSENEAKAAGWRRSSQ